MGNFLYILVPTVDFESMGRGKSVAHAAHAANLFTYDHYVRPLLKKVSVNQQVTSWHDAGGGFGTTVALDVGSQDDMITTVEVAKQMGALANIVVDDTYPYLVDTELVDLIKEEVHTAEPKHLGDKTLCCRREQTCAYVFGDKAALAPLLSKFKLLKNDTVS